MESSKPQTDETDLPSYPSAANSSWRKGARQKRFVEGGVIPHKDPAITDDDDDDEEEEITEDDNQDTEETELEDENEDEPKDKNEDENKDENEDEDEDENKDEDKDENKVDEKPNMPPTMQINEHFRLEPLFANGSHEDNRENKNHSIGKFLKKRYARVNRKRRGCPYDCFRTLSLKKRRLPERFSGENSSSTNTFRKDHVVRPVSFVCSNSIVDNSRDESNVRMTLSKVEHQGKPLGDGDASLPRSTVSYSPMNNDSTFIGLIIRYILKYGKFPFYISTHVLISAIVSYLMNNGFDVFYRRVGLGLNPMNNIVLPTSSILSGAFDSIGNATTSIRVNRAWESIAQIWRTIVSSNRTNDTFPMERDAILHLEPFAWSRN